MSNFIDWERLASLPGVRSLGETLRREWRVFVGLITPEGRRVEVGAHSLALERPLWELLVLNPLEDKRTRDRFSFDAALRRWSSFEGSSPQERVTHVPEDYHGFGAMVREVLGESGDTLGHVYIAGFFRTADEMRGVISVKQALRASERHEHAQEAWFESVPRLSPFDEAVVERIMGAMVLEIEKECGRLSREDALAKAEQARVFCGMLGSGKRMSFLFRMIEKIARSNSTILVLGENGTGKELVAKSVHARSHRRDRSFITVNCAAIPADLIESELFGHVKGSFSGAHRDREGLFSAAHHGTFFLDEIGEMDLNLQTKLLRVLQEGTFLPVGGSTYQKVDVRVICATNRDLGQMVRQGSFRQDLYYRVNVITLASPPLRDRREDIPLLAEHFLHKAARVHGLETKRLDDDVMAVFMEYGWPGNVRELENEIERLAILSGEEVRISTKWISARISGAPTLTLDFTHTDMSMPEAVEALERHMMLEALENTGWNKTRAARHLGVSRRNLIRKVASFGLEPQGEM